MLEPTKKPRTDTVELRFTGPAAGKKAAVKALRVLGFVDVSDSVPWRAALPFTDEELPGAVLAGARGREGFTQRRLAELTGIPQRHISEMENNKRPIGKERAKKLAKALNTSYRVFL